jgi:hypothetical protein
MVGQLFAPSSRPAAKASPRRVARNVRTERKENKHATMLTYWLVLAALVIAMGRSPVSNKEMNTESMFLRKGARDKKRNKQRQEN